MRDDEMHRVSHVHVDELVDAGEDCGVEGRGRKIQDRRLDRDAFGHTPIQQCQLFIPKYVISGASGAAREQG